MGVAELFVPLSVMDTKYYSICRKKYIIYIYIYIKKEKSLGAIPDIITSWNLFDDRYLY